MNQNKNTVSKNVLADVFKFITIPMFFVINYLIVASAIDNAIIKIVSLLFFNIFVAFNFLISDEIVQIRKLINDTEINSTYTKEIKKVLTNKVRLTSILGISCYFFICSLLYLNVNILLVALFTITTYILILEIKDIYNFFDFESFTKTIKIFNYSFNINCNFLLNNT